MPLRIRRVLLVGCSIAAYFATATLLTFMLSDKESQKVEYVRFDNLARDWKLRASSAQREIGWRAAPTASAN